MVPVFALPRTCMPPISLRRLRALGARRASPSVLRGGHAAVRSRGDRGGRDGKAEKFRFTEGSGSEIEAAVDGE